MSRCLDHPRDLVPGADGAATCQFCGASWMMPAEVEAIAAGALDLLAVETRETSAAFAKTRECPDCGALLTPMRIGKLDAWVERCAACERYWVERTDRRSLEAVAKSTARQRAFEALSPTERKEMAGSLAEAVAAAHESRPQLTPAQAGLRARAAPPRTARAPRPPPRGAARRRGAPGSWSGWRGPGCRG